MVMTTTPSFFQEREDKPMTMTKNPSFSQKRESVYGYDNHLFLFPEEEGGV